MRYSNVVAAPPNLAPVSTQKLIFSHWFGPFPRSFNGATEAEDYYTSGLMAPVSPYTAYGGFIRDRPIHRAPLGSGWDLIDMRWDIAKAMEAGIDGWCFDFSDITGVHFYRLNLMLEAALSYPTFKIIPMIDFVSATNGVNACASALAPIMAHPSVYKHEGLPVLSAFGSDLTGVAFFTDLKNRLATVHSRPIAFIPCGLDPQITEFSPISFGIGYWGGRSTATNGVGIGNAINAAGKLSMIPVAPQDYRPKDGIFDEAGNTDLWRQTWQIAQDVDADWVQVVTWNDFSEHCTITPSIGQGETFIFLTQFYGHRFKTGAFPTITQDRLIVSHRKHAHAMVPSVQTLNAGLRGGSTPARDTVEVLAFLTSAKTLTINVGGTTYTESAPAGVSVWTKALGTGAISASVPGVTCTSPHTVVASAAYQDLQYKYTMSTS